MLQYIINIDVFPTHKKAPVVRGTCLFSGLILSRPTLRHRADGQAVDHLAPPVLRRLQPGLLRHGRWASASVG